MILISAIALLSVASAVDYHSQIDPLVKQGLACNPQIPGLTMAVVKEDKPVYVNGFGVKNIESKEPVSPNSVFGIASLSKAFAATLIAKQLDTNTSFTTNTNIYKILGRANTKFNNTLRTVYATVADLLSHRMGIPRNNFMRLDTELSRENIMERLRYLPSIGAFRKSFHYNDLMYGLVAHISEVVGRNKWENLLTEHILRPLGMDTTTFLDFVDFYNHTDLAMPYGGSTKPTLEDIDFIRHYASVTGASGSVMTSASDMVKWMRFHLNKGKNSHKQQVVKEDVLLETYKPLNPVTSGSVPSLIRRPRTPVTMSNDGYALGWKTGWYRGLYMLQHTGTTFGYGSMLTLIPDLKIGVFTAINGKDKGYVLRAGIHAFSLDLALGEKPWLNTTNICSYNKGTIPNPNDESDKSAENTVEIQSNDPTTGPKVHKRDISCMNGLTESKFIGTFKHGAYGRLNITSETPHRLLKMSFGIAQWNLTCTSKEYTFHSSWIGTHSKYNVKIRFLVANRKKQYINTSNGSSVYGLKCLDCDRNYVPVFYRQN